MRCAGNVGLCSQGSVLHLMQPLAHAASFRFCIGSHAAISEEDCMCDGDCHDDDDGSAGEDEWMEISVCKAIHLPLPLTC